MAAPTTTETTPGATGGRRRTVRRLLPIVIAAAILLIAEVAVRIEAHRLPPPPTWSPPEAQVKNGQIDALARTHQTGGVVFLSTSVLDVGLDPGAFIADSRTKLPVYDAALAGADLQELRWWEDHIVLPKLRPKVLVLSLSSRDANANDPQAATIAANFFASDAVRRIDGTESVWQRLERYAGDVSYLFRYRKAFRSPETIIHRTDPISAQAFFTSPLGQELVLRGQPFISGANVQAYFQATLLYHWQLSLSRLNVLAGIINDAYAAGAQVLLVDAPVTQYYIDLHPHQEADFSQYEAALGRVVASTHVPFIPYAVWSDSLFADPIHLDEAGAKRLAGILAARLKPQIGGGSP
jgi:hypothetical protein